MSLQISDRNYLGPRFWDYTRENKGEQPYVFGLVRMLDFLTKRGSKVLTNFEIDDTFYRFCKDLLFSAGLSNMFELALLYAPQGGENLLFAHYPVREYAEASQEFIKFCRRFIECPRLDGS